MLEQFEQSFFDEMTKIAKKKPSRGHSIGVLGGLMGAGLGAYHMPVRGFGTANRAVSALASAPVGYFAARAGHRVAKHIRNVGKRSRD